MKANHSLCLEHGICQVELPFRRPFHCSHLSAVQPHHLSECSPILLTSLLSQTFAVSLIMSSTSSSSPTSSYTIPVITSYVHLGSLPTVTTLPPDCLTNALDFQVDGLGLPYTYFTVGCALSSCCPSGNFYSSAFQWYSEYYSPAVCPSGYVSIAADPIISTMAGETVRFCCPRYADRNLLKGVV